MTVTDQGYTADEIMSVVAARHLSNGQVCFVGIGLPSEAANLARLSHAPGVVLIYESGTIGTRPEVLPLSIGDGELAEQADLVVSVPEIFAYWLQAGRVDVGFLSAAQIDRFGNLNSTVIGDYDRPKVRLPGSGGACEIAIHARNILVIMRQAERSFVEKLHFRTSPGHSGDPEHDRARGWSGSGPTNVVTDLATFGFDEETGEMTLRTMHPGVAIDDVRANMAWDPRLSPDLSETSPPTDDELRLLREELDPDGIYTK
jgi:glutaconate CoA-transferase, subunit B